MGSSKSRVTARARGKKSRVTADGRKILWKLPGFRAFVPNAEPVTRKVRGRKRKQVAHEPVIEPETGIHSRAWAAAIVPQDCGFLRLPLELRMRIYELAIRDFGCGRSAIEPRKKGMKFVCLRWNSSDEDTSRLYLISRQTYLDTVGRGILYARKLFYFASPNLMLNYLWVIHPVHLEALASIELKINCNSSLSLNSLAFEQLAKCRGLKNLYISFSVSSPFLIITPVMATLGMMRYDYSYSDSFWAKLTTWETIRQLRGLKDFRLAVPGMAGEEDKKLLGDIEKSIRKVVLKDGGEDAIVVMEDILKARYEGQPIEKRFNKLRHTGYASEYDMWR